MTKEAKRAAKIEKKLRILLGGYQVLSHLHVKILCVLHIQENYSISI